MKKKGVKKRPLKKANVFADVFWYDHWVTITTENEQKRFLVPSDIILLGFLLL